VSLDAHSLPRHELNGLYTRVVEATDPELTGVAGRVVVETENTLHVESVHAEDEDRRVRVVPKAEATFEFALEAPTATTVAPGPDDGPGDAERVVVAGRRLVASPARRTATTGDPTWR
jgi:ribonuclease P protein subunit POP4